MKRIVICLAWLLLVLSCTYSECIPETVSDSDDRTVRVRFVADLCEVKSFVAPDENSISDMNVYAFRNGILVDEAYSSHSGHVTLDLVSGCSYSIYAVANMGRCPAFTEESVFLEKFAYSIGALNELSDVIPMSCRYGTITVSEMMRPVSLKMRRLVSKVVLSVDKESLLSGLKINSVQVRQGASVVRPFVPSGYIGSCAENTDEIIDGDYATADDILRLNDGEQIEFYTLENCQGILLPENSDSNLKVPEMIPGKKDLCTYLELNCVFDGNGLLQGNVDYRIYLGLDECTSFDMPGNSCINVSLFLTGDALKELSWKVDADVGVRDGYVKGKVSQGMHDMSDLYVGERIIYEVRFMDEMIEYLGGSVEGCSLVLMSYGNDAGGISMGQPMVDDGVIYVEMSCIEPSEGELCLLGPDGEYLGFLDDVSISLPNVILSEYQSWNDDGPVETLNFIPECEINGESSRFYLYLTDDLGRNLNGMSAYGFDNTLFEFEDGGTYVNGNMLNTVDVYVNLLDRKPAMAAAEVEFMCWNTGSDHQRNLRLADVYAAVSDAVMEIDECNFGIEGRCIIGLGIPAITLTVVDNGWAGYHDSQLSVKVDNPSNLPLEVLFCQMVPTDGSYAAADDRYVEENLVLDNVDYMTGEFYNSSLPFYVALSSFMSERNSYGDQSISEGDVLIYPLQGISTDDIVQAAGYNKRGLHEMFHLLDVSVSGHRVIGSDISLIDKVSNGSSRYDYIYYSDESWNYKGSFLYSCDALLASGASTSLEYPYLTPLRLKRLHERSRNNATACVEMMYAIDYGRLSVMSYVGLGDQYGLNLTMKYEGQVNGYVKTYPKGTWYSSQDNYCHVGFSYSKTGVPLKSSADFVWADDGQLKQAVDGIYDFSYKDSDRPLGADAYLHRAHPTDVEMDIGFRVEGEKKTELYPFYVRWDNDVIEYFHSQDNKVYNCKINADYSAYNVTFVGY